MSKRTITIIGAAAGALMIVLLYGLILRAILFEQEQQTLLEDQIASLEVLSGQQVLPTRQAELATAQAELLAAQFAFPREVDTTEVLAHIVATADDNHVDLRKVQAHAPITVTIGEGAYRLFIYDVEVEGELNTISAFLTDLEAGPIGTLTLDQIRLEAQPESETVYRVSLAVQVYVR